MSLPNPPDPQEQARTLARAAELRRTQGLDRAEALRTAAAEAPARQASMFDEPPPAPPEPDPPTPVAPRWTQRLAVLALGMSCRADGFTRRDAAYHAGCYELASRIGELEAEGVTLFRTRITVPTIYDSHTSVTQYVIDSVPPHLLDALTALDRDSIVRAWTAWRPTWEPPADGGDHDPEA